ncbi:MAG: hypothetical protein NW224_23335 [Leptolyngbyaceae cyanobacterium bins.302]|nr:hypothetical protein [Leptolyngbyaceae cyanobacterium bins.302]
MLPTNLGKKALSPSRDRVLDTVPLVVDENQVAPFTFYWNGAVRLGMRYDHELYGLMHEVSLYARLDAYQMGCEMLAQGLPVLITASRQRYALWLNLRNPAATQQELKIFEPKACRSS